MTKREENGMKRRILAVFLCLALLLGTVPAAHAEEAGEGPETVEAGEETEKPGENPEGGEAEKDTDGTGLPGELPEEAGAELEEEPAPEPPAPQAASGTVAYPVEGGNIYFDPSTGIITGCDGSVTRADIPGSIGGVAVTGIGVWTFFNHSKLTSVSISNSVTSIGESAFCDCSGLTSVSIPNSVTSIGRYAFSGCGSLTDIYYTGTKAQWDAVSISPYNGPLTSAVIHYNSTSPGTGPELPQDFSAPVYHAKWLLDDIGTETSLEAATPSGIISSQLDSSGAGIAMDVWRGFKLVFETLDDGTAIYDFAAEPRDMYAALILAALEASSDSDSLINKEFEEGMKLSKSLISTLSSSLKADFNIDLDNDAVFQDVVSRMIDPDTGAPIDSEKYIYNHVEDWFKREQPDMESLCKVFKNFSTLFKGVKSVEEYRDYIASCISLVSINEAMKEAVRQGYRDSVARYGAFDNLSLALSDCVDILNHSQETLYQKIIMREVGVVGEGMAKYLLKELVWKEVTQYLYTACPAVAAMQVGYKVGATVSNQLFDTDDSIEQYLKMKAIVHIEDLFDGTYDNLRDEFVRNMNPRTAEVYLSSMALQFRLRGVDCDTAYKYVDILDNALVSKISQLFGQHGHNQFNDLKEDIEFLHGLYDRDYMIAQTIWHNDLDVDCPGSGLYEYYEALFNGEGQAPVKEIKAACPVNVYVYDRPGNVAASVEDGVVSCAADDVMIALEGDVKTVRFYGNVDYRVEYVGYGVGEMDVAVREFDGAGDTAWTANYYDVPLSEGKTYSVDAAETAETPCELVDRDSQQVLDRDYDSAGADEAHTVRVVLGYVRKDCGVYPELTARKGETLELSAYVPEGYTFVRWEVSGGNAELADETAPRTAMVMLDGDVTVTAVCDTDCAIRSVRVDSGGAAAVLDGDLSTGSMFYAAAYTGEGRLLDLAAAEVDGAVMNAALNTAGAEYVTVFLADSLTGAPLCAGRRAYV